jgi:cytoskeletal protein CcmA (bactofilin family)
MSNTNIQLRKSGVAGNVPDSLAYGELALNYADGKLYYKNGDGVITYISSGATTNSFATINANSSLVIATSNTDILSLASANNITIESDGVSKTITIGARLSNSVISTRSDVAATSNAVSNVYNLLLGTKDVLGVVSNTAFDAYAFAGSAYNRANGAIDLAQSAYDYANTISGGATPVSVNYLAIEKQLYTANASQTDFYINYSPPFVTVVINGSTIDASEYSTSTANTVVLNNPASAGDIIDITGFNNVNSNTVSFGGGGSGTDQWVRDTANNATANTIITQGVDAWQNTQITAVNNFAASAYSKANTVDYVTTLVGSAYTLANTANTLAQSAYNSSNNVNSFTQSAYNTANGANGLAASAYNTANGANGLASGAYNQANTNAANITAVNNIAQGAYNKANLAFSSSGGSITGNVTINGNLDVTGNIVYTGNVTTQIITGNSGQFFGNTTTGFDALYAGIPTGYFIEPQIVSQLSSNYNGYAGFNMQNINPGANSSTDLFITADNGTINDGFVDLGFASSNYNYAGYSLIGKNDGYLFATGNTTTGGGNMIIGTGLENDIVFATGGLNTTDEVMRITAANTVIIKNSLIINGKDTQAVNDSQNTNITSVNQFTQSAYNQANVTVGVDATQNTRLNSIESINTNQNTSISIIQGVDTTQNTRMSVIEGVDVTQNSQISIIQGVDTWQNNQITLVNQFAQGAYNQANGANGMAVGAYAASNTNATNITAVNNYAVSAYNKANNAFANTTGTFAGDLTTTGNIIISTATPSYSVATGSLRVNGGVGVTGNVYADKIYVNGLYWASNGNVISTSSGTSSTNQFNIFKFVATSNQTTFSGVDSASQTLIYTPGAIIVTLNGLTLKPGTDFTATSGSSISLVVPADLNDELNIYGFTSTTVNTNTLTTYSYVATADQTSFGGPDSGSNILGYVPGNLFTTLNGITLRNGVDYTAANGSYVNLTFNAAANDEVVVYTFGAFNVANVYNTSQSDALYAPKANTYTKAEANTKFASTGKAIAMAIVFGG